MDLVKRKEVAQQSPSRMYFIDKLSAIEHYKKGKWWQLRNKDPKRGETFDRESHMRYDFIDAAGNRGVWDLKTPDKIHNVGKVADTNGFDITFITADETFAFSNGGKALKSQAGTNFRILTNGSIWTRHDDQRDRWIIKGLAHKNDIVVRDKGRFAYDPGSRGMSLSNRTKLIGYDKAPEETKTEDQTGSETSSSELQSSGDQNMSVAPQESQQPLGSEPGESVLDSAFDLGQSTSDCDPTISSCN